MRKKLDFEGENVVIFEEKNHVMNTVIILNILRIK